MRAVLVVLALTFSGCIGGADGNDVNAEVFPYERQLQPLAAQKTCDLILDGQPISCTGNLPESESTAARPLVAVCVYRGASNGIQYQIDWDPLNGRHTLEVSHDGLEGDAIGILYDSNGVPTFAWDANPTETFVVLDDINGPLTDAEFGVLNIYRGDIFAREETKESALDDAEINMVLHASGNEVYPILNLDVNEQPHYFSALDPDVRVGWVWFRFFGQLTGGMFFEGTDYQLDLGIQQLGRIKIFAPETPSPTCNV